MAGTESSGDSGLVVKDAAYFDEVRQALGRGAPTALLGTSARALNYNVAHLRAAEAERKQKPGPSPMIADIEEIASPGPGPVGSPMRDFLSVPAGAHRQAQGAISGGTDLVPLRYRRLARLSDIAHGWLDGRRGIPQVDVRPSGEPGKGAEGQRRAAPEPEYMQVDTPQLVKLRAMAGELMDQERIAWLWDIESIVSELARIRAGKQTLTDRFQAAARDLARAAQRPTDEDLEERRTADSGIRLAEAEEAHLVARAHLAQVEHAVQAYESLLEGRAAIARARAHQVLEHFLRRTATYWQQLVRVHPHGKVLNARLRPVGPQLPSWAREAPESSNDADAHAGSEAHAGPLSGQ